MLFLFRLAAAGVARRPFGGDAAHTWAFLPVPGGIGVYDLDDPASRSPKAVELDGNRWGYVEPIIVQPLCLTCHGSELAPDIGAQITELYPDDRATGFEAGDLRGVFWVEFTL